MIAFKIPCGFECVCAIVHCTILWREYFGPDLQVIHSWFHNVLTTSSVVLHLNNDDLYSLLVFHVGFCFDSVFFSLRFRSFFAVFFCIFFLNSKLIWFYFVSILFTCSFSFPVFYWIGITLLTCFVFSAPNKFAVQ